MYNAKMCDINKKNYLITKSIINLAVIFYTPAVKIAAY